MPNIQKNIQMKVKNDSQWEELFPRTKAEIVALASGESVEKILSELIETVNTKQDASDVDAIIAELVDGAPEGFRTLKQIADALNSDPDFAATMVNLLAKKVDIVEGKDLSTNDFSDEYKTKLDDIEENATKYEHPESHPATMITEDEDNRFVTDLEKAAWNDKVDKEEGKDLSTNDFSDEDKEKLDAIEAGATEYVHPDTHEPSIIEQDAENRFVTDVEKATWTAKTKITTSAAEPEDNVEGNMWYEII